MSTPIRLIIDHCINADAIFILTPFQPVAAPPSFSTSAKSTRVHSGFLAAYNAVSSLIVNTVLEQSRLHPTYSIVITGHSLGGALASLAGVVLKASLPSRDLKVYTFGQPRTGDSAFVRLVEGVVGVDNLFRAVHTIGELVLPLVGVYVGAYK